MILTTQFLKIVIQVKHSTTREYIDNFNIVDNLNEKFEFLLNEKYHN